MRQHSALYKRYWFPGEVISHAEWLSLRFLLSYRDVEALRRAVTEAVTHGIKSARDNVIACRVDDRVLASIDALLEAGIHATRSEATARLIHDGLDANGPLLEWVQPAVADIRRLREQTQRLAEQARAERAASPATHRDTAASPGAENGTTGHAGQVAPATRKPSRAQSG